MEIKNTKITLIIFAFLLLGGYGVLVMAENNSDAKNIFLDSDQDGLSDDEEKSYGTDPNKMDTDGDGYSDGSEIQSGYDPLKPAPGDKIIAKESTEKERLKNNKNDRELNAEESSDNKDKNLTEKASLRIAQLIEDQKNGEDITIQSVDDIVDEIIGDEIDEQSLPEIDKESIKILRQDYSHFSESKEARKKKEDNVEYFTAVSYLMMNSIPGSSNDAIKNFLEDVTKKMSSLSDISNTSEVDAYLENLAQKGSETLSQLEVIEVPKDLIDIHIRALQLAKYGVDLKDSAKLDKNDPVRSMVSLSKIQSLVVMTMNFWEEIEKKSEELGIAPMDTEENNIVNGEKQFDEKVNNSEEDNLEEL